MLDATRFTPLKSQLRVVRRGRNTRNHERSTCCWLLADSGASEVNYSCGCGCYLSFGLTWVTTRLVAFSRLAVAREPVLPVWLFFVPTFDAVFAFVFVFVFDLDFVAGSDCAEGLVMGRVVESSFGTALPLPRVTARARLGERILALAATAALAPRPGPSLMAAAYSSS